MHGFHVNFCLFYASTNSRRMGVFGMPGLGAKSLIKLKCTTLAKGQGTRNPNTPLRTTPLAYDTLQQCHIAIAFGTAFIWLWHMHFAMQTDIAVAVEDWEKMPCPATPTTQPLSAFSSALMAPPS